MIYLPAALIKLGYVAILSLATSPREKVPLKIPVISFLQTSRKGSPPPLIGSSIYLDPPTPLQWSTIEACVNSHASMNQNVDDDDYGSDPNHIMATVDAAPLVAILDTQDQSSSSPDGCFAMLAAVVGVSSSSSTASKSLDTSDPSSFQESLQKVLGHEKILYSRDSSTIRLLCVGRATLEKFTSLSPSSEDDDSDDGPILLASVKILLDDSCSIRSNVHAISKLGAMANRISFLHKDRQRLVKAIQAASARLELVSQEWKDHDGLGTLYDTSSDQQQRRPPNGALSDDSKTQSSPIEELKELRLGQSRPMSIAAIDLMNEGKNYGMGQTTTSVSSLASVTKVMLSEMKPYYSPEMLETEEFYYSVYSFVALYSLQSVLDKKQITWALQHCTDTLDRLYRIYEWMLIHKELLQEIAEQKMQELQDCGEECEL